MDSSKPTTIVTKIVRKPQIIPRSEHDVSRSEISENALKVLYRLKNAGYQPELQIGIDPASTANKKTDAHCWVVLDGKPVINDIMDNMITLHVHKTRAKDGG